MSVQRIYPDVIGIELSTPFAVGPVNVYLIHKGERLLLVDAGVNTDEAWTEFRADLNALGWSTDAITEIFLTHHHPDHTGLTSRLPNRPIYAHKKSVPWLERDEAFFTRLDTYFRDRIYELGVPEALMAHFPAPHHYLRFGGEGEVSEVVGAGDYIPGFEEWELVETLGHAQSHLALFRQQDGCFIGGDAILERITSNALMEAPYEEGELAPKPLLQYRETLKKSMTLPIQTVLPGHGHSFPYTKALISRKLRGQERRRANILSLLSRGAASTFQLAKVMFPDVYLSQLDLVLSEVQGHLEWLEQDERIDRRVLGNGHLEWAVRPSIYERA